MKDMKRPEEPAGPLILGAYGAALACGVLALLVFGRSASDAELILYLIGVGVGGFGLWRNWKRDKVLGSGPIALGTACTSCQRSFSVSVGINRSLGGCLLGR